MFSANGIAWIVQLINLSILIPLIVGVIWLIFLGIKVLRKASVALDIWISKNKS